MLYLLSPISHIGGSPCRAAVLEALKPLGTLGKGVYGGDAIYIWAKLPAGRVNSSPHAVIFPR